MTARLAALLLAVAAAPAAAVLPGQPAPAFAATDIDGKPVALSAHAGRTVVIEWTNPACPFVRAHYDSGAMQALQARARGAGVVWLTVNSNAPGSFGHVDAAAARRQLARDGAHPDAYVRDPDGRIGRLYGATATPHMIVVTANGTVAYAGAIDDRPTADPADARAANNHVAAALDALAHARPVAVPRTRAYGCQIKYAR